MGTWRGKSSEAPRVGGLAPVQVSSDRGALVRHAGAGEREPATGASFWSGWAAAFMDAPGAAVGDKLVNEIMGEAADVAKGLRVDQRDSQRTAPL